MTQQPHIRALVPDALKSSLSRRGFLGGTAALGVGAFLAACSNSSGGGGGASSDGLNIYTWGEYDDPAVLKAFTKENGASITIDSYGSNQEMISKLVTASGTSGYDLCVPTHQYIPQMAAAKLLEERVFTPDIARSKPGTAPNGLRARLNGWLWDKLSYFL
jgi:spermidine/putrescine transport system substrate-binding protein